MMPNVRTVALLSVALGLGGCGAAFDEALGLEKSVPDEYQVVQNPPLSIPPDFGLRPPVPGSDRPQDRTTRDAAKRLLTGAGDGVARPTQTPGEAALLNLAGPADPNIRRRIDAEMSVLAEEDPGFVQGLMFWQKQEPAGTLVDPVGETRRLQRNAEAGLPVNEGQTPIIRRRAKAPLEGFNPF